MLFRKRFIFIYFLIHLSFALSLVSISSKSLLVKKHISRLKRIDGTIRLVGGKGEFEGNVEIVYNNTWGAICDDGWDIREGTVVCNQLGYRIHNPQATSNSYFGIARNNFWMDTVLCDGTEQELIDCHFEGWGKSDCSSSEAAGVICSNINNTSNVSRSLERYTLVNTNKIRLIGGREQFEGRVEIRNKYGRWNSLCAEGWSLKEATVVCKTLRLGFASAAMQTTFFGGRNSNQTLIEVKCYGNETSFARCKYDASLTEVCNGPEVAAVACTNNLPDLVIDHLEIEKSAFLEDKPMYFLQCAMEENCLASSAYSTQKEDSAWYLTTRRLLRFTARIFNAGTDAFRPIIPKHLWEWHMCHLHYHSMEVFATFDIFDGNGRRVAEGHKASFCLEDNQCLPGITPKYSCTNYGDQGISINCSDIYKYTVDCQWVDITDLRPGNYKIKVAVNPEYKVAELEYENNAAFCDFFYNESNGIVKNCVLMMP